MDVTSRVQILEHELEADPRNDDERAIDQRWIPVDQHEQLTDYEPHRDNSEDSPRYDDPQLVRHRDRDEDGINGKDDVGQLDLRDGRPEWRHAQPRRRP